MDFLFVWAPERRGSKSWCSLSTVGNTRSSHATVMWRLDKKIYTQFPQRRYFIMQSKKQEIWSLHSSDAHPLISSLRQQHLVPVVFCNQSPERWISQGSFKLSHYIYERLLDKSAWNCVKLSRCRRGGTLKTCSNTSEIKHGGTKVKFSPLTHFLVNLPEHVQHKPPENQRPDGHSEPGVEDQENPASSHHDVRRLSERNPRGEQLNIVHQWTDAWRKCSDCSFFLCSVRWTAASPSSPGRSSRWRPSTPWPRSRSCTRGPRCSRTSWCVCRNLCEMHSKYVCV